MGSDGSWDHEINLYTFYCTVTRPGEGGRGLAATHSSVRSVETLEMEARHTLARVRDREGQGEYA